MVHPPFLAGLFFFFFFSAKGNEKIIYYTPKILDRSTSEFHSATILTFLTMGLFWKEVHDYHTSFWILRSPPSCPADWHLLSHFWGCSCHHVETECAGVTGTDPKGPTLQICVKLAAELHLARTPKCPYSIVKISFLILQKGYNFCAKVDKTEKESH